MNKDGKFDKGRYTTIPETKNIKLPIGGKVRLGVRVKNEKGISYPVETKYFVCPEEVREIYGDEPTELTVFFPVADREKIFPQSYEKYGGNEALLCQGDGETSAQRLNLENGRWEEVKCPCEHYNKKYDKQTKIGGCVKQGYLKFMIPSVSIGTFYQCRVGGIVSIEEINSALELADKTTGGRWAMIPFRMKRVAKKLKIPGTANMKTHWVVTLEVAASTEEIRRVIAGEILYLGQRKDSQYELEATELPPINKAYVPQETEEEIEARQAEAARKAEALVKEYDELEARKAELKKQIEGGKHDLKPYREAKAIYEKEKEDKIDKPLPEQASDTNDRATDSQIKIIYGDVVCETCGMKVYGFRCPKCKNTDLHILEEGFYHNQLMTRADFEKEMKPTIFPYKLTLTEATKIILWWNGDKEKLVTGERIKRESKKEVAVEPIKEETKVERIKAAQGIANRAGKLEIKDKDAPFPDEKEGKPGSSYNNAIPFESKK